MKCFTKILVIVVFCTIFLLPHRAEAGEISNLVDKGINCTAKTAYYITKYTLKGGWFVVKKGTKGAIAVSKSVFKGTNDAFRSSGGSKENYQVETLPPAPKI